MFQSMSTSVSNRQTLDAASEVSECPPELERRADPRYSCREKVCCYSLTAERYERCSARIRDVSVGGVGLELNHGFEPGSLLIIEVQSAVRHLLLPLTALVIHSTMEAEGNWIVGCEFNRRLSPEELRSLLLYV